MCCASCWSSRGCAGRPPPFASSTRACDDRSARPTISEGVDVRSGAEAAGLLGERLGTLGWVRDLWVAGSLASGDYVPGVSDLDLVAVVDGEVDATRQEALVAVHRSLDSGEARGLDLGCQYVDESRLSDRGAEHPTWTHGHL